MAKEWKVKETPQSRHLGRNADVVKSSPGGGGGGGVEWIVSGPG